MSQFSSFKDYIFTYLFPRYYQVNDTYQDSSGKGILQRFIETCSEYLDTEVIADSTQKYTGDNYQPGLDNIVDLIDVDKTPDLFLNYLWEFLGEIPFAYGLIIQGKVYDKLDLKDWVFNNPYLGKVGARTLLKYAISLYKIRGTNRFYEVLGRYYGMIFELSETHEGGAPGDPEITTTDDHLVLATYDGSIATYTLGPTELRAAYFDGDCNSCTYLKLRIGIPPDLFAQLFNSGTLDQAADVITSIIEKYLPIQCKIGTYDDYYLGADFNQDYNNDFSKTSHLVPGHRKIEVYPII